MRFHSDKTFALMLEPPPAPLKANANGTFHGIGWVTTYKTKDAFGYLQDGNWHGTRAFMKRTEKGVNVVAFVQHQHAAQRARRQGDPGHGAGGPRPRRTAESASRTLICSRIFNRTDLRAASLPRKRGEERSPRLRGRLTLSNGSSSAPSP